MDIEFVNYKATPGEKHHGIATVNFNNMILLRYKISPAKDGTGWFPNTASYKVSEGGMESYLPSFLIDSRSVHEKVITCIRDGVTAALEPKAYKHTGSIQHSVNNPSKEEFSDCPF